MSDKEFKLIKLDNDNYVIWKWQFINVLKAKKLAAVLQPKSERGDLEASINHEALAMLGSALNSENMLKIINCDNFDDAWKTLEQCYENKTAFEPQALYQRLNTYKMNSVTEVSAGISEVKGIVAQLNNLGEKLSENAIIGAILSALPSSFDIFTTVWKNSSNRNLDDLISKLMAEANEQIRKESSEVKALISNRKNKSNYNPAQDVCRYCKEKGHWIKDCPNLRTPYDPNKQKRRSESNRNNIKEDTMNADNGKFDFKNFNELAFATSFMSTKNLSKNLWVADSGATHHMTPYLDLYAVLLEYDMGCIQVADNHQVNVRGQGEIITKQGTLQNVLYVPSLGQNLFSIPAASSHGLNYVGTSKEIKFFYKKQPVFTAELMNNLYIIKFDVNYDLPFASAHPATLNEWHSRFSHISPKTIKTMAKNKIVEGLEILSSHINKCEDCALNKCTQVHHPTKTSTKAKTGGSVLHIDTAGPSNVLGKDGSKYLVLCKDEASSYRQIAFVATKNLISNKVKEFINKAQLETGNHVLKIMTDNGSEYVNNDLSSFLSSRGIIHECSVPYVPAQNGFVERDIRTVKEAAKVMLNRSKLSKNLWPAAARCAVYTLNRVINASNQEKVPYELWFGSKPNVKNLKTFGELAILKRPQHKIDSSWSEKGMKVAFIGYTDRWNTYKFINSEGKIFIDCNAVFMNKLFVSENEVNDQVQQDNFWVSNSNMDDLEDYENEDYNLEATSDPVQEPVQSSIQDTTQDSTPLPATDSPSTSDVSSFETTSETLVNLLDDFTDNVIPAPATAPTRTNVPQASKETEIQIVPSTSTIQRNVEQQERVKQLQELFNKHNDVIIKLGENLPTITIKHLKYQPNANNWQDLKSRRFIAKDTISKIEDKLKSRSNIARVFLANTINVPTNYNEAINSPECTNWKYAMDEEIESLIENEVFDEIPLSNVNKKIVGSKWVYTIKYDQEGKVTKYKARVVAKGFSQIYGIDYTETYCSVVQIMSTRLILAHAAMNNLIIKQFDIKTAFLYGDLHEENYLEPPEGYQKEDTVWKLNRSLYGLKQSPRMWNKKFTSFLESIGFNASMFDNSVFYQHNPKIILIVYVDDGLVLTKNEKDAEEVIAKLGKRFKLRELGVTLYRGLEIKRDTNGIFIHQSNYTEKILRTFKMVECNPTLNPIIKLDDANDRALDESMPYRNAIGSLAYLADTTRPDISYAVNQMARKLSNPTENDWKKVKHLIRYLKGTKTHGIRFTNTIKEEPTLIGYSDSDFAGDESTSKSTTGYLICFNGTPFHWKSQLQRHVTLSSTEAEVIALCTLAKELSWIRRFALELEMMDARPALLLSDNTSAIKIAQSEKATARTRHLRAQDAYVVEQIQVKELNVEHVPTELQKADILTKAVATNKFIANRDALLIPLK